MVTKDEPHLNTVQAGWWLSLEGDADEIQSPSSSFWMSDPRPFP